VIALLEAAALAGRLGTEPVVAVLDPAEHPVALAEAAVVANLLLGGRLVLVIEPGDTAEALKHALGVVTPSGASIPVRHERAGGTSY
jgi:alkanesulfonate monooxygenase SsuD/methylene tetrahydromethanopterin reductase-like flavin-dependent oxidoreductase (luciferase family)